MLFRLSNHEAPAVQAAGAFSLLLRQNDYELIMVLNTSLVYNDWYNIPMHDWVISMKKLLSSHPTFLWILIIIVCFIPFILDSSLTSLSEMIWFVYLIPCFILSYRYGLKGGILAAFGSSGIHFLWESIKSLNNSGQLWQGNHMLLLVGLINFIIGLGIGILADQLMKKQKELESVNRLLKHVNEELHSLSLRDELTGLWNRRGFFALAHAQLEKAKEEQKPVAFLFTDLDGFKQVNDKHGHHVGDMLLKEVGERIRRVLHEGDIVSRIGGDEFVVMLQHITARNTEQTAATLLYVMLEPFEWEGIRVSVTPSVGISLYPDDGDELDELVRYADSAMYKAKEQGKCGMCFYTHKKVESTSISGF